MYSVSVHSDPVITSLEDAVSRGFLAVTAKDKYPPAIQRYIDNGAGTVEEVFDADGDGSLKGYVLKQRDGVYDIVFAVGNTVIVPNAIVNDEGRPILDEIRDKKLPKPDYGIVTTEMEYVTDEGTDSKDTKEIWILSDPNCSFCRKTYDITREYVDSGKLKIHWIKAGFLKPTSQSDSAKILALGMDTLKVHFEKKSSVQDSIPPEVMKEKMDAVARNGAVMKKLNLNGTPAVIYEKLDGTFGIHPGFPNKKILESIISLN